MRISAALAIALISLGLILCTKAGLFTRLAKYPSKSGLTMDTGHADAVERDYSPEEEHESNGPEGSAGSPMERLPIIYLGAAVISIVCFWRLAAKQTSDVKG